MKNYKKEYYEQSIFWNRNYLEDKAEKGRIEEIIKIIPSDVKNVLDVGCGNSVFIDFLMLTFPGKFKETIAVDYSKEALRYVKNMKICGTISNLPFKDESFDVVSCLEVLEHLPQKDFTEGILELQRISRKYIVITVPNDQNLERSLVACPMCHCRFNPIFHMRSFNGNNLRDLFNCFKVIEIKEIGPIDYYRCCNNQLVNFYRTYIKLRPPARAICPQCGYQTKMEATLFIMNRSRVDFTTRFVFLVERIFKFILPVKKKKRWLLALYKK